MPHRARSTQIGFPRSLSQSVVLPLGLWSRLVGRAGVCCAEGRHVSAPTGGSRPQPGVFLVCVLPYGRGGCVRISG